MKRFTALFLIVIFVLSMGNTVYAEEEEESIPMPSEVVIENLLAPSNSLNQTPIPVGTDGDSIGTPIPSETPQPTAEPSELINKDLNQLLLISKALSSFLSTEIILENQNDLENVLLTYNLLPIEIQAEQVTGLFNNDLISPIIIEASENQFGILLGYLTDEQNAFTSLTMIQADATETIIGIDDVASLWAYTVKESEEIGESVPTPSATGIPSASPSVLPSLATPSPSVSAEPIDEALAEEVESKAIGSVSLDSVETLENSGEIAIAKGETITLSASAVTNSADALEYKFYYQIAGTETWSTVHSGYIAGRPELGQAEFKPATEATYNFKVQVRTTGTTNIEAEDVFGGDVTVYFGDYPSQSVTISPLTKTQYEYSETIPLAVTVEQNKDGSPVEYQVKYSTNGSTWSLLTSTKYWPDLDIDEAGSGVIQVQLPIAGDKHYFIQVEIRSQFRTTVDASDICEVDMYKYMPLESVTLDSVAGFTSEDEMVLIKGETIEIRTSAAAKDGYAPEFVDYRVLYQRPGSTKWYYVSSKYTTGTLDEGLIIFKPKYEGVYHFKVEARTKGRTTIDVNADFEAPIGIYFGELPANGLSIAEIIKTNYEYTENIPIQISVMRSHNDADVEYQVMYSTNNRSWRVLPEYKLWKALTLSDENTADLQISIPSGADRHLYVKVNIRSESREGVDVSDVFEVDMYKIMPLEKVTLISVDEETAGGNIVLERGQEIRLSAVAGAQLGYLPEQVEYRFMYQRPGSTKWYYVSKRFASGTLTNGGTLFVPKYEGTYEFKVQARTKGRASVDAEDEFDDSASLYFGDIPLTDLSFSTDMAIQEAYHPIKVYPVIEDLGEGDIAEIKITAKCGTSTYLVEYWTEYVDNMEVVWRPMRVGSYTLIVEGRKKARTGTDVTKSKDGYEITPVIPVEGVAFNPTPEDSFVDHGVELVGEIVGDAHSDDAEYRFSYRINSSKWKVIQDWTSDDGCLFTPLVSGTYTYRVEARSPGQASGYAYCTAVSSVVREKPPAPMISTDKTEYAYMEDIVVTWSDTARATHHDLYIYKDGIRIDRTKNLMGTSTTINLPEGSYEVSVAAVNETGFTFAEQRAALTVNRDKPTAITDFRTSQSVYTNPCDVVFNWTHAERITHYDLYIYDSETGDFVTRIAPITDNTAMTALEYGKYKANILAINEEGYTVSNWTEFEVKIQKPGAPTYTTSQRVFDIDGDIELAWTAADRAFSYTLYIYSVQKDNEGQEELVWHKAIAGIVTTHTTIELDEGTYVVFPGATNTTGTTFGPAIRIKVEDVQPLEGVALSVTANGQAASTALTGTPITMTASVLGSVHTNDAEYAFYYQNEYGGWNPWDLIQDWSTSNTVTFTPPVASDYILIVLARSPGETTHSAAANRAFKVITMPPIPFFTGYGYDGSLMECAAMGLQFLRYDLNLTLDKVAKVDGGALMAMDNIGLLFEKYNCGITILSGGYQEIKYHMDRYNENPAWGPSIAIFPAKDGRPTHHMLVKGYTLDAQGNVGNLIVNDPAVTNGENSVLDANGLHRTDGSLDTSYNIFNFSSFYIYDRKGFAAEPAPIESGYVGNPKTFFKSSDWITEAGDCYILSYAMLINWINGSTNPNDVYLANGSTVNIDHYKCTNPFGMKYHFIADDTVDHKAANASLPSSMYNAIRQAYEANQQGVIVYFRNYAGDKHAMLVTGYDNSTIYFHDPARSSGNLPFESTIVYGRSVDIYDIVTAWWK